MIEIIFINKNNNGSIYINTKGHKIYDVNGKYYNKDLSLIINEEYYLNK